jgi:hypothetical protein
VRHVLVAEVGHPDVVVPVEGDAPRDREPAAGERRAARRPGVALDEDDRAARGHDGTVGTGDQQRRGVRHPHVAAAVRGDSQWAIEEPVVDRGPTDGRAVGTEDGDVVAPTAGDPGEPLAIGRDAERTVELRLLPGDPRRRQMITARAAGDGAVAAVGDPDRSRPVRNGSLRPRHHAGPEAAGMRARRAVRVEPRDAVASYSLLQNPEFVRRAALRAGLGRWARRRTAH